MSLDDDRLHALFKQYPTPCQIVTREGNTILVNKAWMEMRGFEEDFVATVFLKTYNLFNDAYLESYL